MTEEYDFIRATLTGLSGTNRHLRLPVHTYTDIVNNSKTIEFSQSGLSLDSLLQDVSSLSGQAYVIPETLHSCPWINSCGENMGEVLCEIAHDELNVSPSPRTCAVRQINKLKEIGLTMKSAFEAEFMLFEADATSPMNYTTIDHYGRLDTMCPRESLMLDTCLSLQEAGIPIETFMSEFSKAQFEITFKPQDGVKSADSLCIMKDCVRESLGKEGVRATFMSFPSSDLHANGFHFNHSLWRENNTNAMLDTEDPNLMSDIARFWVAGLVKHGPALTALFCPTVNCYRRLEDELSPNSANWGIENRFAYIRMKTEKQNVYAENRLPSAACNPYMALAGTIAAGLDGIKRKLTCPPQEDEHAHRHPKSLEEAVAVLKKDTDLIDAIGQGFINSYINMCEKSITAKSTELNSFEKEREVYFDSL